MIILDYWPYNSGLRLPGLPLQIKPPFKLIESVAGGIAPLLKNIQQHKPDVLIGDFGVRARNINMSRDEYDFRKIREKHPQLPIVMCGITDMVYFWHPIQIELCFEIMKIEEGPSFEKLPTAIAKAKQLVS